MFGLVAFLRSATSLCFAALLIGLGGSGHAQTLTPAHGGAGGAVFSLECRPNEYLTGVTVRHGALVDAIAPICSAWSPRDQRMIERDEQNPFAGGPGGQRTSVRCRPDEAIRSFYVQQSRDRTGAVGTVQATCADAAAPRGGNVLVILGQPHTTFWPRTAACPAGQLGAGLHGRAGAHLDAVGLICRPAPTLPIILIPLAPTTPAPGAMSVERLREPPSARLPGETIGAGAENNTDGLAPAQHRLRPQDLAGLQHTPNEIVFRHESGQLHFWTLVQGARYAGVDLAGASRVPAGVHKTIIGDMNGDGEDDIIFWANSGQISFKPVQSGSASSQPINIGGPLPVAGPWELLGAGDINGDGTDDLIFRRRQDQRIHYWRIRNGLREDGIDVGGSGYTPESFFGAGDLNGDGTDDLVWLARVANPSSSGGLPQMRELVRFWPMRNGGRLGTVELGERPIERERTGSSVKVRHSWIAGVGDIDGVGADDILWRRADGQLHYWSIRDGAVAANRAISRSGLLGPEWTVVGVGNVDGH